MTLPLVEIVSLTNFTLLFVLPKCLTVLREREREREREIERERERE